MKIKLLLVTVLFCRIFGLSSFEQDDTQEYVAVASADIAVNGSLSLSQFLCAPVCPVKKVPHPTRLSCKIMSNDSNQCVITFEEFKNIQAYFDMNKPNAYSCLNQKCLRVKQNQGFKTSHSLRVHINDYKCGMSLAGQQQNTKRRSVEKLLFKRRQCIPNASAPSHDKDCPGKNICTNPFACALWCWYRKKYVNSPVIKNISNEDTATVLAPLSDKREPFVADQGSAEDKDDVDVRSLVNRITELSCPLKTPLSDESATFTAKSRGFFILPSNAIKDEEDDYSSESEPQKERFQLMKGCRGIKTFFKQDNAIRYTTTQLNKMVQPGDTNTQSFFVSSLNTQNGNFTSSSSLELPMDDAFIADFLKNLDEEEKVVNELVKQCGV